MKVSRYLNEFEVERITGFSVGTLRNWRSAGKGIPYLKVGRSVRYKLDDVLNFMDSHKVRTYGVGSENVPHIEY